MSGRWWHAYGGLAGEGWGGAWALLVAGPSTTEPGDLPDTWVDGHLRYLHSWDHEPSDHEKDLVTPGEFREPWDEGETR